MRRINTIKKDIDSQIAKMLKDAGNYFDAHGGTGDRVAIATNIYEGAFKNFFDKDNEKQVRKLEDLMYEYNEAIHHSL